MPKPSPLLRVDLSSGVPVYRQIVDALRALLVENVLQKGDILPTVRQLALDLGIHFNTVAEAYRILAEEGWLELRRRRGVLVIDRLRPPDRVKTTSLVRRVRELVAELQSNGIPARTLARELRLLAEGLEQ